MSYEIDGNKLIINSEESIPIDNDGILDLDGLKMELDIYKVHAASRALDILKESGLFSPSVAHGEDVIFYKRNDDGDGELVETDELSADWGDEELITDRRVLFNKMTNKDGEEWLQIGVDARPKFSTGTFYSFSVATVNMDIVKQAIADLEDSAPAMR